MKYDDASWHYEGVFPPDLPPENGGTHIALFLAWAAENNLLSSLHTEDYKEELEGMKRRETGFRDYFFSVCDEKLTSDDLNELGNRFAADYYENGYFGDYMAIAEEGEDEGSEGDSVYRLEATWENYERIRPIVQGRFDEWRRHNS